MLLLSVNPTTVPGGTTITGTAGVYIGDAVYGRFLPWTLTNYGALQPTGATSIGVDLEAGGEVVNSSFGSVVGSISGGYDGVVIRGEPGTLINQGTISPAGISGVGAYLNSGGTIVNGASGATSALIAGGIDGVAFVSAPGTVTNQATISATGNGSRGRILPRVAPSPMAPLAPPAL